MGKIAAVFLAFFICGCASNEAKESVLKKNDAIEDYIIVSEIESVDVINTTDSVRHEILTADYIIVHDRRGSYLLTFNRRCHELYQSTVTPDYIQDRNRLRAKFDTYRGCQVQSIYELNPGQAEELKGLAE